MNEIFSLASYDYELPERMIAQTPAEPRDSSKLMVLNRQKKSIEHRIFRDITEYFLPDDLLVLNDTRVIPARILGKFGDKNTEILLLRPTENENVWQALVKPGKFLKRGAEIKVDDAKIKIIDELDDGVRLIQLSLASPFGGGAPKGRRGVFDWIEAHGTTPLPPYIKSPSSREAYQTVFAHNSGSAAAPTASLHFTKELLEKIKNQVEIAHTTLHVGLGTFRPVRCEDIREHVMHFENCTIPAETAQKILDCKSRGGRVIASGTTVVRTLESFALGESGTRETNLFITPGFKFKVADAMITNFHTPKSSLLMLVSAFADDREFVMHAYKEAILKEYRFFSFGDAMFIV